MTNADKFKQIFGIYATELWAMSEEDFLAWLNAEAAEMMLQKIYKARAVELDADPWDGEKPHAKDGFVSKYCKKYETEKDNG